MQSSEIPWLSHFLENSSLEHNPIRPRPTEGHLIADTLHGEGKLEQYEVISLSIIQ
jgi:hypothetical protein